MIMCTDGDRQLQVQLTVIWELVNKASPLFENGQQVSLYVQLPFALYMYMREGGKSSFFFTNSVQ